MLVYIHLISSDTYDTNPVATPFAVRAGVSPIPTDNNMCGAVVQSGLASFTTDCDRAARYVYVQQWEEDAILSLCDVHVGKLWLWQG